MVVRTWWRRVSLGGGAVTCMGQVIRSREKITYLLHYNCLPSRTRAPPSVQRCVGCLVGFLWQAVKNLLTQWELRRKTDSSRSMKNPKTLINRKGKKRGENRSQILWRISKQQANASPSSARYQRVDRASACR